MHIRVLSVALLLIGLAACGTPSTPASPPSTPASPPTSPPADRAGNPAVPGPVLSAWRLWDPVDPALPAIIEPYEGRYRLRPGWDVSAIDYLYEWSGLGSGRLDVKRVTRSGAEYQLNGAALAAEDVQRLAQALDNLYPSQSGASWQSHTDDYPSWGVDLYGSDGASISLSSSSTGNPGNAPWVVSYNGRIYLQYDGAIGLALDALFDEQKATPAGSVSTGGASPGEIRFSTFGVYGGAIGGVTGLFPLSAELDAAGAAISGTLAGPEAVGRTTASLVQSIDRASLTLPDGSAVECALAPASGRSASTTSIRCPVSVFQAGQRYELPITVQYTDEQGAAQERSGVASGIWGESFDYIVQPLPTELAATLPAQPALADLLRDHILIETLYTASVKPAEPLGGTRSGSARLLGQTTIDGAAVRYTVNTPFALKDGALTRWSLDRSDVERMLAGIVGLPVTRRVVQEDPEAIIDLWYAEAGGAEADETFGGMNSFRTQDFDLEISACGATPGATLPSASQPLQLFSFNTTKQSKVFFGTHGNQFLLRDDSVVVIELDLDLVGDPDYGLMPDRSLRALIPAGLDTGPGRGFSRIWLNTSGFFGDGPSLTLWIPDDATPEETAAYQTLIEALPGTAEHPYDQAWEIADLTLVLTEDGGLKPQPCK